MLEDRDTWIDPPGPEVDPYLFDAEWRKPDAVERYVLLDASFVPGLGARLAAWAPPEDVCSLYAGVYDGEGLDQVAPYLVRLPPSAYVRRQLCEKILRVTRGKPMLSLLHSMATLEELAAHLRVQVEAVNDQGKGYLLRLADTRSFAGLMQVLTPPQRARLMAGIARWSYVDRDGIWRFVEGSFHFDPQADTKPFQIDADQQLWLNRLALPDAILRFVQLRAPLFGELACAPSVAHRVIQDGVLRLVRRGLDNQALAYRHALTRLRQQGLFGAKPQAAAELEASS